MKPHEELERRGEWADNTRRKERSTRGWSEQDAVEKGIWLWSE
jgi:hypothetical protein